MHVVAFQFRVVYEMRNGEAGAPRFWKGCHLTNFLTMADPENLKRGSEDNMSGPSSFIANAHNEIYAILGALFKKKTSEDSRGDCLHRLPLEFATVSSDAPIGFGERKGRREREAKEGVRGTTEEEGRGRRIKENGQQGKKEEASRSTDLGYVPDCVIKHKVVNMRTRLRLEPNLSRVLFYLLTYLRAIWSLLLLHTVKALEKQIFK